MSQHPESINCPACGSSDFITIHSDLTGTLAIRLVSLRQCAECDAKYFPPVPRWISAFAVMLGTCVAFGGIYLGGSLPAYFAPEEFAARLGMRVFFYLMALVGCGFAVKGVLRLISPKKLDSFTSTKDSQIYFEDGDGNESRTEEIEPLP
jgi:predicted phage tail protein